MFGTLLNIITIPIRATVAPIKLAERTLDPNTTIPQGITDTLRYTITGKEKHNDMNDFMNFDDED